MTGGVQSDQSNKATENKGISGLAYIRTNHGHTSQKKKREQNRTEQNETPWWVYMYPKTLLQ